MNSSNIEFNPDYAIAPGEILADRVKQSRLLLRSENVIHS